MRAIDLSNRSVLVVAAVLACLGVLIAAPASGQTCANDPTRTIFAGGPNTEACRQFSDEATCEKAFHRSGAGHLAPCHWFPSDNGCFGNTANWVSEVPRSCEQLPPQTCVDASRTIMLEGGTSGDTGSSVCQTLNDRETCEMAWHTSAKGVGISCCWDGEDCIGSVWGFFNGDCSQRNTCFLGSGTATAAPALSPWALFAIATALLGMGALQLRAVRRRR
jgi:hypothetical protein